MIPLKWWAPDTEATQYHPLTVATVPIQEVVQELRADSLTVSLGCSNPVQLSHGGLFTLLTFRD